jgi:hypothetical protein
MNINNLTTNLPQALPRLLKETGGSDIGLLPAWKVKLQERQLCKPQVHVCKGGTLA